MTDPTPRRRLVARLAAPLRWAAGRFYFLPRGVRAAVLVLLVVGTAAGAYYATTHLKKRARAKNVAAAWRDFEDAARKSNADDMRAALDRVLAADATDANASRRKLAIDSGSADADAPMSMLLMNMHLGANRLSDAAREAEKVLAAFPKDWQARCVLAHHAATVLNDRDKAAAALAALPDPEDAEARLHPGGLLYALRLSDVLGRDAAPLRALIVRRLLPALRSGAAANAPPVAKVQLIERYLEPFADADAVHELAGFWAPAAKLADAAVTEAADGSDAGVLIRLAQLGDRTQRALVLIRDHERLPAERFAALAKDVTDRTRRAWLAAKDKDAARPEPYLGLARLAARANDRAAAVALLQDGLAKCGDRPELLDLLAAVMAGDDPMAALKVTWAAAEKAGTDPVKWCLAANAAANAKRQDMAIHACELARRPPHERHPWACFFEARLRLRAGEPAKAVELLGALGPVLRTDPLLAALHARALTESGLSVLLDDKFAGVIAAHDAAGTLRPPVVPVAFLRGVLEANPDAPRIVWAAAKAGEVTAKWPDDAPARRLAADALFRKAELSIPPWNPDFSRAALRAFDAVPLAAREDPSAAAMVSLLQLRGTKDAPTALRTITPLRAPDAVLNPAQMEAVGAVLTANGRAADAVAVLERTVAVPGAPAGCWVQLALAYRATRQFGAARAALDRVLSIPSRSDREHAEYVAASILLRDDP